MPFWLVAILTVAATGALLAAGLEAFARRGVRWGSTAAERAAVMTADAWVATAGGLRVAMTRAVDLVAPPADAWPWIAQAGRGAGWYSFDRLDNGGRASARHVVSWIPAPRVGDATAIGWLRGIVDGEQLSWWAPGLRYPGVVVTLAVDMRLTARADGSRLVVRISAAARGPMARPTLWLFRAVDSVMAIRQLGGIRERAAATEADLRAAERAETGDRAQYQLYQTVYASGEWSGSFGREQARHWHRQARASGDLPPADAKE